MDNFFEFYGFTDEIMHKAGHYLSYYHDLGKLSKEWQCGNWKEKPPHTPLSFKWLEQNSEQLSFPPMQKLTPLLWYLIGRHHGSLKSPRKISVPEKGFQKDFIEYLGQIKLTEIYGTEYLIKLVDIFGLFKVADCLSALSAESERLARNVRTWATRKFKCDEETVKRLIGSKVEKERWKGQIQIKNLPEFAMLRAPTGWGKTTVALLYAINKPCTRVFYMLPTVTAISEFYKKLHKVFRGRVSEYFYFYDADVKENEDRLQTLFFTRSFLSPIVITTLDQFLLSMLQVGKYHTRRVSFRNSILIVDEIHLLNPLMLHLLTSFIVERNKPEGGDYGIKALFMSATLPRAYRQLLAKIFGIHDSGIRDFAKEYEKKRRVMYELRKRDIGESVGEMYKRYKHKKCVLVVVNTVDKAVRIGRKLRDEVCRSKEKKDIVVLHARFMHRDRRKKERTLKKREEGKIPHIAVTTQICEVSLDISYDVLYTEAASLASIIQRFGRVNRRGGRTKSINTFVHYPPEVQQNKRYPYEPWEIEKCWEVLKKFRGGRLASEKDLIDEFDQLVALNELEKRMEDAKRKVNLEAWHEILNDFYSFDVAEEELKETLDYRESFTVNTLLHPSMILDKPIISKLKKVLATKPPRNSGYLKRKKWHAEIKEFLVPVPIWLFKKSRPSSEFGSFPMIFSDELVYGFAYGVYHRVRA